MILDFQFGKDTAEEIEGQLADCRLHGSYPVRQISKNGVGGDYPCEVETRLPLDERTATVRIGKDLAISQRDVWASVLPWAFEWVGYALPEQSGL
jgi:hypothetical protein